VERWKGRLAEASVAEKDLRVAAERIVELERVLLATAPFVRRSICVCV
jgi:hypothetical protein